MTKVVRGFESAGAVMLFSVGFFLFLGALATSFLGYKKNEFSFVFPAWGIVLVVTAFFLVAFYCCCSMETLSYSLLRKWENQTRQSYLEVKTPEKAYRLRVIKSLHAIETPVGNLCVINRNMEMLYYNLLLNQLVNVLMGLNRLG